MQEADYEVFPPFGSSSACLIHFDFIIPLAIAEYRFTFRCRMKREIGMNESIMTATRYMHRRLYDNPTA